jgi:hypothetical protein
MNLVNKWSRVYVMLIVIKNFQPFHETLRFIALLVRAKISPLDSVLSDITQFYIPP